MFRVICQNRNCGLLMFPQRSCISGRSIHRPEGHPQLMPVKPDIELAIDGRAKAKVHIVPEDGRIAALGGHGAWQAAGVSVAFEDFKSGSQSSIVKSIAQLAESAAHAGDDTPFAQFPARRKAAPSRRARHMCPKAKDLPRPHYAPVQAGGGKAQVLHLSGLEGELRSRRRGVERIAGLSKERRVRLQRSQGKRRRPAMRIVKPAMRAQQPCLSAENQSPQTGGRGFFGNRDNGIHGNIIR
jgi:hypothetical protein